MGVVQQLQGLIEGVLGVAGVLGGYLGPAVGLGALLFDAVLLGVQHVLIDLAPVEEMQELLLLALELLEAAGVALGLADSRLHLLSGVPLDRLSDGLLLARREAHAAVEALDGALDGADVRVAGSAASSASLAAEAAEVLVEPAVAGHAVEDQSPAAVAAEDRASEVVPVLAGAVASQRGRFQHLLNLLEGLAVDEGLVTAVRVLGAVPRHYADVVVVVQHLVNLAPTQRHRSALRGHAAPQTGFLKHVAQAGDRVVAGRVCLEGHLYQRGAVGVDGDGADFAALDALAGVDVADWGLAERATVGVLAGEPHLDLLGIAAGAEGVDSRHDGVEQSPGGRVVGALQSGLQLAAVTLDLPQQPERIEVIARDSREVVEDDVGRPKLGELGQHVLERRAPRVGPGAPRLHELGDDARPELLSVALTGLTLAGDRVALRVMRLVHLTVTGHPQIHHRCWGRMGNGEVG
ncbi:MAG TPA: hypothetical protein VG147_07875 [Solirubrobacteraceae bacterium]|nr:hypothetical protein [Solirubrobacteraceae bacterium]